LVIPNPKNQVHLKAPIAVSTTRNNPQDHFCTQSMSLDMSHALFYSWIAATLFPRCILIKPWKSSMTSFVRRYSAFCVENNVELIFFQEVQLVVEIKMLL
jgi:hypothetical protein